MRAAVTDVDTLFKGVTDTTTDGETTVVVVIVAVSEGLVVLSAVLLVSRDADGASEDEGAELGEASGVAKAEIEGGAV